MTRVTNARSARRSVLFDAVGTLIFADPPVAEVYRAVAHSHGVKLSLGEIEARIKSAIETHFAQRTTSSESIERERWRTIVADVFRESPDHAELIFADLWTHFASPNAWRLFNDVEECFAALQASGIEIAIASNFDARLKNVCCGHDALQDVETFCSSELGFAKPHGNFFRVIQQQLELLPAALTMVGDDLAADHQGAQAAGWNSLRLNREGSQAQDCIVSLSNVPELLALT